MAGGDRRDVSRLLGEHEEILRRNGKAILQNPLIAIDAISKTKSTFSKKDIANWLFTHCTSEQFEKVLNGCLECPDLLELGQDSKGQTRYTSRINLQTERDLVDAAKDLANTNKHSVSAKHALEPSFERRMGLEQELAYRYITQESGDLAIVQGYAGSGKSYLLGAANEAWKAAG